MNSNQDDWSLLDELRKLYARIMTKFMNTHTYHDGAADIPEIMSTLTECIDKLATQPAMTVQGTEALPHESENKNGAAAHVPTFPVPNAGLGMGELSAYFRSAHKHSGLPSDTGEKLIHTTWEHIDAAIRAAHQMDVKTARLHVELANNAFKEAAHYLSDAMYSNFSRSVMQALHDINSQQTP